MGFMNSVRTNQSSHKESPLCFRISFQGKDPQTLQSQVTDVIEHIIRKATDNVKDPSCTEMVALSPDQKERGKIIREYVRQIPAVTATEILERLLNYGGESELLRKVQFNKNYKRVHCQISMLHFNRRLQWMFGYWCTPA